MYRVTPLHRGHFGEIAVAAVGAVIVADLGELVGIPGGAGGPPGPFWTALIDRVFDYVAALRENDRLRVAHFWRYGCGFWGCS